MITFYDIPSNRPHLKTWSPNTWKTRYILNYKGIPHKTIWVEYPNIESTLKELGVKPTGKRSNGNDLYTLPAIIDSTTGAKVADSIDIAAYLDETYPDTPKAFPHGSSALQRAFYAQFYTSIQPVWSTVLGKIPGFLNEGVSEWYYESRSKMFGKPLEEVNPVGEARVEVFKKIRGAFDMFDGFYQKNGGGEFVMGEIPSFMDFVITSVIQGLKLLWGVESEEWKDFESWNGGRWAGLLDRLEQYAVFRG